MRPGRRTWIAIAVGGLVLGAATLALHEVRIEDVGRSPEDELAIAARLVLAPGYLTCLRFGLGPVTNGYWGYYPASFLLSELGINGVLWTLLCLGVSVARRRLRRAPSE